MGFARSVQKITKISRKSLSALRVVSSSCGVFPDFAVASRIFCRAREIQTATVAAAALLLLSLH